MCTEPVDLAIAPMSTGGMAISKQPRPPRNERSCARDDVF